MTAHWQHFAHEADIGIRGIGNTREQAFAQAALALTAVITDPAGVHVRETVSVKCDADDDETLLVDWINSIVYETATRKLLFARFELRIDGHTLHATLGGEAVTNLRHQPAVEVKGATYTELMVKHENGLWIAQCVVDV